MDDGVSFRLFCALYSHKARCLNQWERVLHRNFIIISDTKALSQLFPTLFLSNVLQKRGFLQLQYIQNIYLHHFLNSVRSNSLLTAFEKLDIYASSFCKSPHLQMVKIGFKYYSITAVIIIIGASSIKFLLCLLSYLSNSTSSRVAKGSDDISGKESSILLGCGFNGFRTLRSNWTLH